jgi:hypothetical protein
MTAIAFTLNCLLVFLLMAAMMVGLRLEKRLRGLRDSHKGFAQAALDLNAAIARAEGGLGEMRKALHEAEETLTERVDEARAAARKLEAAMQKAQAIPQPPSAQAEPRAAAARADDLDGLPIKDLLARLRSSLPIEDRGEARVLELRDRVASPSSARSRARIDDDLFDLDMPRRAGAAR